MKLTGVRVLDLSSFIPGPYLTLAMADHGADVLKIEAPAEGDPARRIGVAEGPHTIFFRNFNRGKRSVVLDLKREEDRKVFLRLADEADVVVESSRPGVAARLGIDYDTLRSRNPRIIYCSITAFGQDGRHARRPAHDLAIQGQSGILSCNLGADGRPAIPALPSSDILAGLQGLAAVLMALYARQRSNSGDYIDISMQEATVAGALNILGPTLAMNRQPIAAEERSTGGSAFYRIYDTGDGRQLVLGGQEMKFVTALLGALDGLDLAPLCEAGPGPHQRPVIEFLQRHFSRMTLRQAADLLDRLDMCWSPVNTLVEALEDAHLAERNFILRDEQGGRHIGPPIRFRHEPARPSLAAPALDQDGSIIRSGEGRP